MKNRFTNGIIVLGVAVASSLAIADGAQGQARPHYHTNLPAEKPIYVWERAYYNDALMLYQNLGSIKRFSDFATGFRSFSSTEYPEHEMRRDVELTNIVTWDMFEQQVSSDPVLRTPDLENPYTTSLRSLASPTNGNSQPLMGSEFIFENLP